MRGTAALCLGFILLGTICTTALGDDEFELTLASGKEAVPLGGEIPLRIRLGKKRGKPVPVHTLRLAKESISLLVTAGGRTHLMTRIYAREVIREDGTVVMEDEVPPRGVLRRGRPLWLDLPVLGLIPGPCRIRAMYRGLSRGPDELLSEEITVQVGEADDRDRIGAVIDTSEGALFLTLWPDRAYMTVHNFLTLTKAGRYDGLTFHRVIREHLIQGGDPKGDGTGRPDHSIPGEFDARLKHVKGVISMARPAPLRDAAGVQFFIMHGEDERFDGNYAAFGKVEKGLDVLDRLASVSVRKNPRSGELSLPEEAPIIRSVRALTK